MPKFQNSSPRNSRHQMGPPLGTKPEAVSYGGSGDLEDFKKSENFENFFRVWKCRTRDGFRQNITWEELAYISVLFPYPLLTLSHWTPLRLFPIFRSPDFPKNFIPLFLLTSYIIHLTSYIFHLTSYILHLTSYIIHHTSYILHLPSYIFHLTSYIFHLTSYIFPLPLR